MALTFDWAGRVVESSASILDLPAFHAALRDAEDDEVGAIHPVIHTWKALSLGGGAFFYGLEFINGWVLKFPVPGAYEIAGNLGATIVPAPGVYVERRTSAAFSTTAVGSGGLPPEQIALLQSIEAKLSQVNTGVQSIPTTPLLATDPRLDNLDAPISEIEAGPGGGGGGITPEQYDALVAEIRSRSSLTLSQITAANSTGSAVVSEVLTADVSTDMPLSGG